jgi:hypothetical protein
VVVALLTRLQDAVATETLKAVRGPAVAPNPCSPVLLVECVIGDKNDTRCITNR